MVRGLITGRLRHRLLGGIFDPAPVHSTGPGRTTAPVITARPTVTVPPASTAPRANTGRRVSLGPARPTNPVPSNRTDLGHKVLKPKENPTGHLGAAGHKVFPVPNKTHVAHTPAGRAR